MEGSITRDTPLLKYKSANYLIVVSAESTGDPCVFFSYIAFLSGLGLGPLCECVFYLDLCIEMLTGQLGGKKQQEKMSKVAALIIAGNLLESDRSERQQAAQKVLFCTDAKSIYRFKLFGPAESSYWVIPPFALLPWRRFCRLTGSLGFRVCAFTILCIADISILLFLIQSLLVFRCREIFH